MPYLILVTILWAFSFSLIGQYLAGQVDSDFAVLARVLIAAVNALPALLDAAAERDELAAAWDEGHQAGHEDARAVQSTYPEPTPNPYRAEGDPR